MDLEIGIWSHGHSLHRPVEIWEKIIFGEPPHKIGRASLAVLLAIKLGAKLLGFGTGATKASDGQIESEVIRDFMLQNFNRLQEFSAFRGINLPEMKDRIGKIITVDKESKNTIGEIGEAAKIFRKRGIQAAIFITDAAHAPRLLRDVAEVFHGKQNSDILSHFFVTSSEVPYCEGRTVVIDPSHPLNPILQKLLKLVSIYPEKTAMLSQEVELLLEKYGLS